MHITQLKLLGFKSFVEPTSLLIRPGLTGVVGPNGCGKSNLLEALRWVMGESSYKAMRGGEMDDVIFSGTQTRPARNQAEVTITIDNSSRTAPAEFNDDATVEIVRFIQRGEGSRYRVNGRDVRAKDVKLLFEDAATGARSHALVRQGQIGEIVNAKPQARRRILEDAAGIAGLHSRRHEAELRLNAAEDNLERIADLIGQMDAQLTSLKRQARHAERYKELSQKVRHFEALVLYLKWQAAGAEVAKAEEHLSKIGGEVATQTGAQATALKKRETLLEVLRPLRLDEAKLAAGLERLTNALDALGQEEAQALRRKEELSSQLNDAKSDLSRDQRLIEEGEEVRLRLNKEIAGFEASLRDLAQNLKDSKADVALKTKDLAQSEAALMVCQDQLSRGQAGLEVVELDLARQMERAAHFLSLKQKLEHEQSTATQNEPVLDESSVTMRIQEVEAAIAEVEPQLLHDQTALTDCQNSLATAQREANDAALKLKSLDTEIGIIETLLSGTREGDAPSVIEAIEIKSGYEKALWAALGDDLDVPLEGGERKGNQAATAFWRQINLPKAAPLPKGVQPLLEFVTAPSALAASLAFVGLVSEGQAARLQTELKPGQKLVSKSGGLWRWDGFVSLPDAPSSLPRRLIDRNRLPELLATREVQLLLQAELATKLSLIDARAEELELAFSTRRGKLAELQKTANQLYLSQREIAQQLRTRAEKQASLASAVEHATSEHASAVNLIAGLKADIEGFASLDNLKSELEHARAEVMTLRQTHSEAQLSLAGFLSTEKLSKQRIEEIISERDLWATRTVEAKGHIEGLQDRIVKLNDELETLDDLPQQFMHKRQKLLDEISAAEGNRNRAGDALAKAEAEAEAHEQQLRRSQADLMALREDKARVETRLETARSGFIAGANAIETVLNVKPEGCLTVCGIEGEHELPTLAEAEADAARYKQERDRLGAVNLLAADEIKQLEAQFETLVGERDDLAEAVAHLRRGISQLNEEGRQRLMAAFEEVNGHFKRLFQTLFSGGEAELRLIESDDPLEAGLEIIARPPGKRPQVLTLLSGGEKALTAMSLLFAVFLTNPSPICVLDEVDAPLDDTNVDRFCRMMEEMAASTDTRFLVITHHPMTMERMDRLFGVTMSEQGVSQLVSVDLSTAEAMREQA